MKGLNDMEFNIGDVVQVKNHPLKLLAGAVGVIREKNNRYGYLVEFSKSVTDHPFYSANGVKVNGFFIEGKNLVLLDYTTNEEEKILNEIRNQRVNEKCNTWEVHIRPFDEDKDSAYAELYVNGRLETIEYVNRYHKDEYNAGTACIEICKKLFGIEDKEEKSEEVPAPKYYTGKVICTGDSRFFTKGKIYKVENGTIYPDTGEKFVRYESLEQLNDYSFLGNPNFIEFVE